MTGLSLSDAQIKKIINVAKKHTSVTIRISKNSLNGSHKLPLNETQVNQMNNARGGMNLTLTYEQIKQWIEKQGGILPLLTLIPIIASALGVAGGIAGGISSAVSTANSAKASAKAQTELERHNREVEN